MFYRSILRLQNPERIGGIFLGIIHGEQNIFTVYISYIMLIYESLYIRKKIRVFLSAPGNKIYKQKKRKRYVTAKQVSKPFKIRKDFYLRFK